MRRAGIVVEIGARKGQCFEGLIELEDSIGYRVVSELGDIVGKATEFELGEAAVGRAVSAGEGEGDI